MSDRRRMSTARSGRSYVVTLVNDRAPRRLHEFVDRPVVAVTAASNDEVVEIHGSAHFGDNAVLLHEKDRGGTGRDIRTWRVCLQDGRFVAVERSIY